MSDSDDRSDYSSSSDEELEEVSYNKSQFAPIYLTDHEWFIDLPILFNSSSRRKKDASNFIAPERIRDSTYRCKEYPGGVYIDQFGKVCEDDPRTGIFRRFKTAPIEQLEEHLEHIDDDDDDDEAYDDENNEEEEEDDDEEWNSDDESDENEADEYEDEEDEYVPAPKNNNKKRKQPDDPNDQSTAPQTSKKLKRHQNDSDLTDDCEDEDDNEYELTEEDRKIVRVARPTDRIADLQQDNASHERMLEATQRMAQRRNRSCQLMSTLEIYSDVWDTIRKKRDTSVKINFHANPSFYMTREGEEPSCPLTFTLVKVVKNGAQSKKIKQKRRGFMDCNTSELCCGDANADVDSSTPPSCTYRTRRADEYYAHIRQHFQADQST